MRKQLFYLILILILLGCTHNKAIIVNGVTELPDWYWKPSINGRAGGVGESGYHIDGISAQRQLAISRALDELARQKGVTVESYQTVTQTSTNHGEESMIESYSIHTTQGVTLNVQLIEIYRDNKGRIYAWVLEVD